MSVPERHLDMSIEEYLEFEEKSQERHEFLDGQVFAMSGASLRHNIITNNLHSILSAHLKGGRCRSFTLQVKVRIKSINSIYYPDVVVSCTPIETSSLFIESPVLIAEVLSPSTAAIDRREKLMAYKRIESLREYLIVHQTRKQVDVFRKTPKSRFSEFEEVNEGSFTLGSLPLGQLAVQLDKLYEEVDWGEPSEDSSWLVREAITEYSW